MALTIRTYHPHTLTIDGEPVKFRFARFDVNQAADFNLAFARYGGARPESIDSEDPAYEREVRAWLESVYTAYVAVEPGEIVLEDEGRDVTSGTDFLRLYGGRFDVLFEVLTALWLHNTLTADQKKAWRSRSGSANGSIDKFESSRRPDGGAPATIADDVSQPVSSSSAGVPPMPDASSGMAGISPSGGALSGS